MLRKVTWPISVSATLLDFLPRLLQLPMAPHTLNSLEVSTWLGGEG